jgi:hypothetical protein
MSGARKETALEATGARLAEVLRRALADRLARRMDGLSLGVAEWVNGARQVDEPGSTGEEGARR